MHTESFKIKSGNKTIVGRCNYPDQIPAPAVLLLHGFTNHTRDCAINTDMFDILPSKGFIAIEFDFLGSGQSDGVFKDKTLNKMLQNYKDVKNFIKKDKRITNISVVGKSISGIFPIIDNDSRIKSIALLSTAIRPSVQFYRWWKNNKDYINLGLENLSHKKGKLLLSQTFFKELYDIERKILLNIPHIKNVINFQGTADNSVPFDQGHYYHLLHTLPKPFKSVLIEKTGHKYLGKESFVINEIIGWFKKFK